MVDAQLLARVWDWAAQAVEPVDAESIARGAAARVPLLRSIALRVPAGGTLVPAIRWPAYGFVLLLVLASLLAGALLVGSQQRDIPEQRLPPPFGPARNGVIVFSHAIAEGHSPVVQFDPVTGETATLRSGGWLVDPRFSPDGRQILFREQAGNWELSSLWVMNADGSGARQLLPAGRYGEPAWSPGSDRILVMDNEGWLNVVAVAKGTFVRHSLGIKFADEIDSAAVSWRPNHDQVLVSQEESYLVNADGTGLRSLPEGGNWSPDGSTIGYSLDTGRVDVHGRPLGRVHLLEVDSGVERKITFDGSDGTGEDFAAFSPDGTKLLIYRNFGKYPPCPGRVPARYCWRASPILVPVAGGGPEVVLGTFEPMSVEGEGGGAVFSPDGKQVLGIYGKEPRGVWLYDADTGEATAMTGPPWDLNWWGATWQRLAP
jgi:hypothetical protein